MIRFDNLPLAIQESMCTPMNLILPPSSSSPSSSSSSAGSGAGAGALWVGSIAASVDTALLHEHNITHIVQVLDVPWVPRHIPGFESYRVDLQDLPTVDLKPFLIDACAYIDAARGAGGNVLVHCQQVSLFPLLFPLFPSPPPPNHPTPPSLLLFFSVYERYADNDSPFFLFLFWVFQTKTKKGISRSCAVVIGYLIQRHDMTYDDAFEFVRQRRLCLKPNSGFVSSLREWEGELRPHLRRSSSSQNQQSTGFTSPARPQVQRSVSSQNPRSSSATLGLRDGGDIQLRLPLRRNTSVQSNRGHIHIHSDASSTQHS